MKLLVMTPLFSWTILITRNLMTMTCSVGLEMLTLVNQRTPSLTLKKYRRRKTNCELVVLSLVVRLTLTLIGPA